MSRYNPPTTLHHELHAKPTQGQHGRAGSAYPKRYHGRGEDERQDHAATAPQTIRQESKRDPAKDRPNVIDNRDIGNLGPAQMALLFQEGRIKVFVPCDAKFISVIRSVK